MTFGIIDIGSNTIRMNIYHVDSREFYQIMSSKDSAGLVSYIKKGVMQPEGTEKLAAVLKNFKIILSLLHVDQYAVFATASLRNIKNSKEVIDAIEETVGMKIDLLSGAQEGSMSFSGAFSNLTHDEGMYIDTGGGSTEVVLYNRTKIQFVASMPIGSLNLYNKYVENILPTRSEIKDMEKRVIKELKAIEPSGIGFHCSNLAVTGGSFRAVRSLLIHLGWIAPDEFDIKPKMCRQLIDYLLEDESESIRHILKVKADRLHTLMTGLVIVSSIAAFIHAKSIQVSTNGLREGYLMHQIDLMEKRG